MSDQREFFRMFYTETASSTLQTQDISEHLARLWAMVRQGESTQGEETTWMLQSLAPLQVDGDRLRRVLHRLEPLLTDEQIEAVMAPSAEDVARQRAFEQPAVDAAARAFEQIVDRDVLARLKGEDTE